MKYVRLLGDPCLSIMNFRVGAADPTLLRCNFERDSWGQADGHVFQDSITPLKGVCSKLEKTERQALVFMIFSVNVKI